MAAVEPSTALAVAGGSVAETVMCWPSNSGPDAPHVETVARIVGGLRRSLVAEGIDDDLYEALEDAFSEGPPPRARHAKAAPARFGAPRRRPVKARPLPAQQAARLCDRYDRASRQLLQTALLRVARELDPTAALQRLRELSAQRPDLQNPDQYMRYLRQYALAILAVLDLMGDDA